jgi:UDP-N-acetylglucosamine--N-acetylmuramyl-(pentapeptide) pyrophosphoryl-undecaprenol N-acetylglucosamine transferase
VGLPDAEWVGNPVREPFWDFDGTSLREEALRYFGLEDDIPVLGVFGGSLGAGSLNKATTTLAALGVDRPLQIVHLTGDQHLASIQEESPTDDVTWTRVGFEASMEMFYAASDLVLARAGGAVAELTATATPSILVPGDFGSAGHQSGNANFLSRAGAAVALPETELGRLRDVVIRNLFDEAKLKGMRSAACKISKPGAARTVAEAMIGAH